MVQYTDMAAADTPADRNIALACIEAIRQITPGATVGGYGYESDTVTALSRLIERPRTVTVGKSIPDVISGMAQQLMSDARNFDAEYDAGIGLPRLWQSMGEAMLDAMQRSRPA